MSYKRYWVALAIVIIGSFLPFWVEWAEKMTSARLRPFRMCTTLTVSFFSLAVPSRMGKGYGSRSAGRKSEPSGDTGRLRGT